MKAVILAGGLGSRMSEETRDVPKPMVNIGGMPIIWHIMKTYSVYGVNEFVLCLGYKGEVIKKFFIDYLHQASDLTIDIGTGAIDVHPSNLEPWKVTLVNTGQHTQTGGRLRRVREFVGNEDFHFTYGDSVLDIDVGALSEFHRYNDGLATVTAVRAPERFGELGLTDGTVTNYREKPHSPDTWINGGFFILSPQVIDLIPGDNTVWEEGPLEELATKGDLKAYRHTGFWHPMDTLKDKMNLQKLWSDEKAPWKVW